MIFLLLFLILTPAQACVFEIRSATFYTDGTQVVTRDWFVVDFKNEYNYELFDIQFNDLVIVPVVGKGERIRLDPYKNVTPVNFPISIRAFVITTESFSKVEYSILNKGRETDVTVKIPLFAELLSCENCEIKDHVFFKKTLKENEFANFSLITTRSFSIPDGEVIFTYKEDLNFSFTANVPVTIEKGFAEKWIGNFKVSNIFDKDMKVRAVAFVEFCNLTCKRLELFNESFLLRSNEVFSKKVEVESSEVPIFIFKVDAKVEDFCPLLIVPAKELDGRYLIGSALLKGFSYTAPEIPRRVGVGIITPTVTPTPITTFVVRPEVTIPLIRFPKEVFNYYIIATKPAFFGIFILTLLLSVRRRGLVALKEHEKLLKIPNRIRIYTPPSSPLIGGIVVEPDEKLVSELIKKGISREYAEAISIAIKVKKPLVVSDLYVAKFALSFGIPVIIYGRT